ncbi:MAG: hypothetical protein WCV81_03235 [Microgenomates group bacterium]|jgi:hypothetical protein
MKEQNLKGGNNNLCPYCGAIFEKLPKRKTKCPKCEGECFVRTTQTIFPSTLLTKEDALAADFFKELEYLGATTKDYTKIEAELSKRWDTKAKSYDVVWGISNWLITQLSGNESTMLHNAKMITFGQALYQANRGKNPNSYLGTVHDYEIQIAKRSGLPLSHFVIEADSCCKECSKYQGKKYTAEELKKDPILPIKECTNKLNSTDKFAWCTCIYSPHYL